MDKETTSPQTRIMIDALLKNKKREPQPELKQASVGRNAPCPCGSGRKFKKCCLHALKRPIKQWVKKDG